MLNFNPKGLPSLPSLRRTLRKINLILAEYKIDVKKIQVLKVDHRTLLAEIIMGEVKWLELKATHKAFLPSSP